MSASSFLALAASFNFLAAAALPLSVVIRGLGGGCGDGGGGEGGGDGGEGGGGEGGGEGWKMYQHILEIDLLQLY